jgi:hypothetical protein
MCNEIKEELFLTLCIRVCSLIFSATLGSHLLTINISVNKYTTLQVTRLETICNSTFLHSRQYASETKPLNELRK